MLAEVTRILLQYFGGDTAVAYELIPETGGYPRHYPVCSGTFLDIDRATQLANQASTQGMLGDFLRHQQLFFEEDALSWTRLAKNHVDSVDYSQLISIECVRKFLFLPITYDDLSLAAIFIHFRQDVAFDLDMHPFLSECLSLVGLRLAYLLRKEALPTVHKRMAIAHSVYGQVSATLNSQIDSLQQVIAVSVLGKTSIQEVDKQLEVVRYSVFSVMRELVINAADNVLVDLDQMTFAKAIHTTAVALERAWPNTHQVKIEVPLIPVGFERFSLPLRELLYTLVLELMGNAIRHGGPAAYIHVGLEMDKGVVYVEVHDHGQGFDPDFTSLSKYGLGFWKKFIPDYLNGFFHIASQKGFGTVVRARIPTLY